MAEEKIRLGGMALPNGVLVHGPNAWGCAVRLRDGRLKVESGSKRLRSASIDNPLLRGPAKIAEVFALLPEIRRKLPEAKLPFERPRVLATMLGSAVAVRLVSGLLSVAPAALALRGSDLAGYHGAEHISIGTYEHDEPREREHERCGSHMLGPLLLTTGLANAAASRIAGPLRGTARVAASLGGLIAST